MSNTYVILCCDPYHLLTLTLAPSSPPRPAVVVAPMMYGFGDHRPAEDSVKVMEEILIDYITEVVSSLQPVRYRLSLVPN